MRPVRDRNQMVIRQWRMLVCLRRRRLTIHQLANRLGVCRRTVIRDIEALEAVPFPIVVYQELATDEALYALAPMPEWPRDAVSPIAEVRHAG